jgi:hypothetical protein
LAIEDEHLDIIKTVDSLAFTWMMLDKKEPKLSLIEKWAASQTDILGVDPQNTTSLKLAGTLRGCHCHLRMLLLALNCKSITLSTNTGHLFLPR